MRRGNRYSSCLFGFVVATTLSIVLSCLHRPCLGQEILEHIPEDVDLVVWVDSFPELYRNLKDNDLDPISWLLTGLPDDRDEIEESPFWLATQGIADSLEQEAFDGPLAIQYRMDGGKSHVSVCAHTTLNDETLQEFIASINTIWKAKLPTAETSQLGRASPAQDFEIGEHVKLVDNWLCWASSTDELERIVRNIEGRPARKLLAFRVFTSAASQLAKRDRSDVCFYVGENLLQEGIASSLDWTIVSMHRIRQTFPLFWRMTGLSEVRGLSGRFSFGNDERLKASKSFATAEAFVIVTEPRHGIPKVFEAPRNLEFEFDISNDETIQSIFVASLNGTTLTESIETLFADPQYRETSAEHAARIEEYLFNSGYRYFHWSPELARQLDGIGRVCLLSEKDEKKPFGMDVQSFSGMHFGEPDLVADDLRAFVETSMARNGLRKDTEVVEWREGSSIYWQASDKAIAGFKEFIQPEIDRSIESSMEYFEKHFEKQEGRRPTHDETEAHLSKVLRDQDGRIAREVARISRIYKMENGWVFSQGSLENLTTYDERMAEHAQLVRLKNVVQDMNAQMEMHERPFAVYANWQSEETRMAQLLKRRWKTKIENEPESGLKEDSLFLEYEDWKRAFIRSQVRERIGLITVIAGNSPSGYEVRGLWTMEQDDD